MNEVQTIYKGQPIVFFEGDIVTVHRSDGTVESYRHDGTEPQKQEDYQQNFMVSVGSVKNDPNHWRPFSERDVAEGLKNALQSRGDVWGDEYDRLWVVVTEDGEW